MQKLNLSHRILVILLALGLFPLAGIAQFAPSAYPSTIPNSHIRNWQVLVPQATPDNVNISVPTSQALLVTNFLDGLGRALQDVSLQGSLATASAAVDLVTPYYYDAEGRQPYKYIAFGANSTGSNTSISDGQFKLDPFQQQTAFYATGSASSPIAGQNETYFYGQTNFESTPLDRPTEMFLSGNNWVGTAGNTTPATRNSKKLQYWMNTATDAVRIWIVNNSTTYGSFASYTSTSTYPANTLTKTISFDEQGNESIEFKDIKGNLILKKAQYTAAADNGAGSDHPGWLCTYYIYDDLDMLRCVIQPVGVQLAQANSWNLSALSGNILNEECYRLEYDLLKRLIVKQIPGAAPVYSVYDTRNRVVMTQDGNLRNNSQWLCHLFDGQDREVMTATVTYSGAFSTLQSAVTTQTTPPTSNSGLQLDLTLPNSTTPSPTTGTFQTLRSITLAAGFSTPSGGPFTATIAPGGADGETSFVSNVVVNLDPIPTGATNLQVLTITHYDDYTGLPSGLSGGLVNSNYSTFLVASAGSPDYAQPIVASAQTKGLVTWTQALVLGTTSQFISTAKIYNEKGTLVQTQTINITGGLDVTTNQYNFSGKLLYTHLSHQNHDGAGQSYQLATKNTYDALQRLVEVDKNFNNTVYKTISKLTYDAVGHPKTKSLGTDPNNSPNPLETLTYDYNIQGWLIGANRIDLATPGAPTNGTHFAFELGFDKPGNNTGQNFSNPQFNGNLAGVTWKSIGDNVPRKYDYTYDPVNRLFTANFVQQNPDNQSWNNSEVNYNVLMGDGANISTAYDANGNIQRMQQWGFLHTSSAQIDDLNYVYYNNGNKLASVTDKATGGTTPTGYTGMYLGDFVDKNTGSNDYGYDANGNLLTDLNKRLNGSTGASLTSGGAITYNFLNQPTQIQVKNDDGSTKGSITYVYDASGNKLQKITVEGTITTTTWYISGFVYQTMINTANHANDYSDLLQYVLHEEGRIRYRPLTGSIPAAYVYDYFIKDHLGSTRMILTDEAYVDVYPPATLEGNINTNGSPNAIYYENNFYTIDPTKVVGNSAATGITPYINKEGGTDPTDAPVNNNPNSVVTANSLQVYQLTSTGSVGVTGLGITLKVMSGDRIDIWGKSYYFQNNASQSNFPVPVGTILSGLLGTPTGVTAERGVGLTDLTGNSALTGLVNGFATDPNRNNNGTGTTPKAYINWILFDDNFQYVMGNYSRVGGPNAVKEHYNDAQLQDIQVTKNGYIYVYVENESPVSVFFDNLQVVHTHGPLVEETHYYPFGLTMEGISDKVPRTSYAANKYKFTGKELQNKEFSDGTGLEWTDYGARMDDQQIGRWHNADPKADKYYNLSPYNYVANNPMIYVDPDGQRIIFVNGYLGFGSPTGGSTYWNGPNSGFVTGAQDFFNDHATPYFTDVDHGMLSDAGDREDAGRQYAEQHYDELTAGMDINKDQFEFVTHSMGAAFGEGMITYLKQRGWKVADAVHIEPFQAADFGANKAPRMKPGTNEPDPSDPGTFVIDYQESDDWVLSNFARSSPGDILNADKKFRVRSNADWQTRHRDPIDRNNGQSFWDFVSNMLDQQINNRALSDFIAAALQANPSIVVTIE